jgi:hypothetical protein
MTARAPLHHDRSAEADDATLASEARAFLERDPASQVMAELWRHLRALELPWWSPAELRARWPATLRMQWLAERPDLRQRITSALTGLTPNAARRKTPEFQGSLLDSVVDDGDVPLAELEAAFEPLDLVPYAPLDELWRELRARMPWGEDSEAHRALVGAALEAFLATSSPLLGEAPRPPLLTAWDVRHAIDGRTWHERLPIELRVAIDDARLAHERARPTEPFLARDELRIATPQLLARHLPLRALEPVFAAAERAMGLEPTSPRPRESTPARALQSRPPLEAPQPSVGRGTVPTTSVEQDLAPMEAALAALHASVPKP